MSRVELWCDKCGCSVLDYSCPHGLSGSPMTRKAMAANINLNFCGGTKGKPNWWVEGNISWHTFQDNHCSGEGCQPCPGCHDCNPDHWCSCGKGLMACLSCRQDNLGHVYHCVCHQDRTKPCVESNWTDITIHHDDGTPLGEKCRGSEDAQNRDRPATARGTGANINLNFCGGMRGNPNGRCQFLNHASRNHYASHARNSECSDMGCVFCPGCRDCDPDRWCSCGKKRCKPIPAPSPTVMKCKEHPQFSCATPHHAGGTPLGEKCKESNTADKSKKKHILDAIKDYAEDIVGNRIFSAEQIKIGIHTAEQFLADDVHHPRHFAQGSREWERWARIHTELLILRTALAFKVELDQTRTALQKCTAASDSSSQEPTTVGELAMEAAQKIVLDFLSGDERFVPGEAESEDLRKRMGASIVTFIQSTIDKATESQSHKLQTAKETLTRIAEAEALWNIKGMAHEALAELEKP